MSYRLFGLFLVVAVLMGVGHVGAGAVEARGSADSPTNLLTNPGFEGEFSGRDDPYTGIWANELGVAEGWEPWYNNAQVCPPYDPDCPDPNWYNVRPEYKAEEGTSRVRSGDKGQKFFTTYGSHTAGFYQTVEVPADSWVRFSIWVWVWSSDKDIPEHSFLPGDYRLSVGIDPTGGTDWQSEDIRWSEPVMRHDAWVQLQIEAHTEAEEISVWTRGAPLWAVKHNDSYWDDAKLTVLEEAPAPTFTPSPTSTPYPTPDPTPTNHEPEPCWCWGPVWEDRFESEGLANWGQDAAEGSVGVESEALWVRNGSSDQESFPLAWSERSWPAEGDLRLSFRFAYENVTAYGSTIGVGSEPYEGERILAGSGGTREDILRNLDSAEVTKEVEEIFNILGDSGEIEGIEDILRVHHRMSAPDEGEYSVKLLGERVWEGTPGGEGWHDLVLELTDTTYTVYVDGEEVGKGVSYWRPRSLYLGNPVIVWNQGQWAEVAIDDVRLERCGATMALQLPLIMQD